MTGPGALTFQIEQQLRRAVAAAPSAVVAVEQPAQTTED